MNADQLSRLARDLDDAWARAVTMPAPSSLEPSLTTEDAYAIQEIVIDSRVRNGRSRAGWKMGLTSAMPPATPIVGTLLDDMIVASGSELSQATMVAPMVEAELVVRIGMTLDRAQTVEELMGGPHQVGPGLEVIDYRTTGSAGPIDWIADNSTVAYAVVGELSEVSLVDAAAVEASLSRDGRLLATGSGAQVMGNPLAAVAWLSGHLVEHGHRLEEGDIVLTGSLSGHHSVEPGVTTEFEAVFGELGAASVRFTPDRLQA